MGLYYLGAFPPGYGGVTIKNLNLYTALSEKTGIVKVDFNKIKKKSIRELFLLIYALIGRHNRYVIGVSGKKTRKNFSRLLYYINRKAMNHSIIMIMGGTAAGDIANDKEYKKYATQYKRIYVETAGMQETLENAGLKNGAIYPNCRFRPNREIKVVKNTGKLKCVFFSLVQPEKGVDLIIEAAKKLPDVEFSFYGHIDEGYRQQFFESINALENVNYHGIFSGTSEDVYSELTRYDILLLPTKWDIEGVPGILVEAKIAGIACIVSKKSYNAEIVRNGIEGIVLENNTVDELSDAIQKLNIDRDLLRLYQKNSADSADDYYIENYTDKLITDMGGTL